ncbi:MAG TPA: tail fiber domain-containing protein, partial [Blastocatellia bacterium]|nr:tail fiber domain-containing protein [Blastocatellia bacterium]
NNSYFGFNTGATNTSGNNNSIFGTSAGNANTSSDNSFFGFQSGNKNTFGTNNAFFGSQAGSNNTQGSSNAFFGFSAGISNTTASNNAFFGNLAGQKNTTGVNNTFIGNGAGLNSTTTSGNTFVGAAAGNGNNGSNNTFIGINSGLANVGSNNNTFIGANVADSNLTGSGNTYIGSGSDGAILVTNSTAIGQNAFAGQSNSVIIGSINGVNGATADTQVGIGITQPSAKLHVKDNAQTNVNLIVENAAAAGAGIQLSSTQSGGATWQIFSDKGNNSCCTLHFVKQPGGEVLAINATPASNGNGFVNVNGDFSASGTISVGLLSSNGNTSLCKNAAGFLATCSSSLRYKKDLQPYTPGLSLINRLNPIIFRWKSDNSIDLGFGAEDVAKVEPLLVTHNAQGQVEGVKYDRITAALVNAVKEQQTQITEKQTEITQLKDQVQRQQQQLDSLKKLVCAEHPGADICKQN